MKNKAIPENKVDQMFSKNPFFDDDIVAGQQPLVEKIVTPKRKSPKRTVRPNGKPERTNERTNGQTIVDKYTQPQEDESEHTERESFEIYPSLRDRVDEFLFEQKKKRKKRLAKSEFYRDAIEKFLDELGG